MGEILDDLERVAAMMKQKQAELPFTEIWVSEHFPILDDQILILPLTQSWHIPQCIPRAGPAPTGAKALLLNADLFWEHIADYVFETSVPVYMPGRIPLTKDMRPLEGDDE